MEKNTPSRKRSVCFHDQISNSSTTPQHVLSEAEIKALWYSSSEIKTLKKSARRIARCFALTDIQRAKDESSIGKSKNNFEVYRKYRRNLEKEAQVDIISNNINNTNMIQNKLLSLEDYEPRGLENQMSFERQINKYKVLRSVLVFQNRLRQHHHQQQQQGLKSSINDGESKIANLSLMLTRQARENALVAGQADFITASSFLSGASCVNDEDA